MAGTVGQKNVEIFEPDDADFVDDVISNVKDTDIKLPTKVVVMKAVKPIYKCGGGGGCNFSSTMENVVKCHRQRNLCSATASAGGKKYKCEYCSYETNNGFNLKRHSDAKHLKLKPVACPFCEYVSAYEQVLNRHIRAIHNIDQVMYRCKVCNLGFKQRKQFDKHAQSHRVQYRSKAIIHNWTSTIFDNNRRYACDMCQYSTSYHGFLKRHKASMHSQKPFGEIQTYDGNKTLDHLVDIEVDVNGDLYECHTCDFKSAFMDCLDDHITKAHMHVNKIEVTLDERQSSSGPSIKSCQSSQSYNDDTNNKLANDSTFRPEDVSVNSDDDYDDDLEFEADTPPSKSYRDDDVDFEEDIDIEAEAMDCDLCDFSTYSIQALDKHVQDEHESDLLLPEMLTS